MYEKYLKIKLKSGVNKIKLFNWMPEKAVPSDITIYEKIEFYGQVIEYEENITL